MPRPNLRTQRRRELLPIIARTFAEDGYRRTTTARLASDCGVRENILYRLWPDKKSMFVAVIEYVFDLSRATWEQIAAEAKDADAALHALLDYEAAHHGEFGHYRILFAGLSETDDPDIHAALRRTYRRFAQFIARQRRGATADAADLAAWAVIGLGTVANIGRELKLLTASQRAALFRTIGRQLLLPGA